MWKTVKHKGIEYPGFEVTKLGLFRKDGDLGKCQWESPNGYTYVKLGRGKDRINASLHLCVIETFSEPRLPWLQVHHIDGNSKNNQLDNLEYRTHQDICSRRKKRPPNPLHTKILSDFDNGVTRRQLSHIHNLHYVTICKIIAAREKRDFPSLYGGNL